MGFHGVRGEIACNTKSSVTADPSSANPVTDAVARPFDDQLQALRPMAHRALHPSPGTTPHAPWHPPAACLRTPCSVSASLGVSAPHTLCPRRARLCDAPSRTHPLPARCPSASCLRRRHLAAPIGWDLSTVVVMYLWTPLFLVFCVAIAVIHLINPLPFPGNRDFGVGHVPWRSPARNPTKFGHIKLF